jgi:signal transduction histidine kinase
MPPSKTLVSNLLEPKDDLERYIHLGKISANLIHDISSPLTAAILQLETYNQHGSESFKATKRSLVQIQRYIEAARQQLDAKDKAVKFSVAKEVRELKNLMEPIAKKSNVALIVKHVPKIEIYGNGVKFQQILINLVANAIESYQHDQIGELKRIVLIEFELKARNLYIIISDFGQGIKPSEFSRIFEPFYTTKQAAHRKGLGLGLAIVKSYVVDTFKGSIRVCSSSRIGTKFQIQLPVIKIE